MERRVRGRGTDRGGAVVAVALVAGLLGLLGREHPRRLTTSAPVGSAPLVDPGDLVAGGPPPDGIPPIDHPRFQPLPAVRPQGRRAVPVRRPARRAPAGRRARAGPQRRRPAPGRALRPARRAGPGRPGRRQPRAGRRAAASLWSANPTSSVPSSIGSIDRSITTRIARAPMRFRSRSWSLSQPCGTDDVRAGLGRVMQASLVRPKRSRRAFLTDIVRRRRLRPAPTSRLTRCRNWTCRSDATAAAASSASHGRSLSEGIVRLLTVRVLPGTARVAAPEEAGAKSHGRYAGHGEGCVRGACRHRDP